MREKLGLPGGPPEAGLAADPLALRNALALQGEIQDLWAPEVTTLNNEPAMVHVSTDGSSSLTMTVLPQISADGIVQLSISHEWGARAGDETQGFLKSVPMTRVSGSDTVTRVMDGSTNGGVPLDDEVWVRTVYAFAAATRLGRTSIEHLADMFAPLYMWRASAFMSHTALESPAMVQARLNSLCETFQRLKPGLVASWSVEV